MSKGEKQLLWGKATWILLHSLAERIDPRFYRLNYKPIFELIKTICANLPCPDCAGHAKRFLSRIDAHSLYNKELILLPLYLGFILLTKV